MVLSLVVVGGSSRRLSATEWSSELPLCSSSSSVAAAADRESRTSPRWWIDSLTKRDVRLNPYHSLRKLISVMRTPSSTIRATFHNASVTLKVRPSLVADTLNSQSASTASLCRKAHHKSLYGQPVFPLSAVVFKLDVSPFTTYLQSVLAHLTTALEQVMCLLPGSIQPNHALS